MSLSGKRATTIPSVSVAETALIPSREITFLQQTNKKHVHVPADGLLCECLPLTPQAPQEPYSPLSMLSLFKVKVVFPGSVVLLSPLCYWQYHYTLN